MKIKADVTILRNFVIFEKKFGQRFSSTDFQSSSNFSHKLNNIRRSLIFNLTINYI